VLVDRFGDKCLESGGAAVAELVGDFGGIAAGAQGGGQQQVGDVRAVLWVVGDRAQAVGLGFVPRLLLIFVTSVPSRTGAALSSASGSPKTAVPAA
jgi:hypothetical protein